MDGERIYMKFEKVVIKNFRNFDNVELDLSNKNIFFGLNDVGKTNFLWLNLCERRMHLCQIAK